MFKLGIGIPTCWRYRYPANDQAGHASRVDGSRVKAIRETWLKDAIGKIDVKFFYGNGAIRAPQEDEVVLCCPDDYYTLPLKVQEMFRWFRDRDYDFVLKCDDDVMVYVDRLLANFEPISYRGYEVECATGKYASGTAYWVGRWATHIIANAPWNSAEFAEDKFVGRILKEHGIGLTHDERYHCCRCEHCLRQFPEAQRITSHCNTPQEMYELHKENS